MKKSILFTAIIGAFLLMTSCLKEGNSNYSYTTFVYLDSDDMGTVYGKTISPYFDTRSIISNEMLLMMPNRIKIMSYSWDEVNGTKPLRINGEVIQADYVTSTSESVDVDHTYLNMTELPEIEEPLEFIQLLSPLSAISPDFMGDYWIFEYMYEVPSGQSPVVEFYKREQDNPESDEVVIDVHLKHVSSSTNIKANIHYVALNMSELRSEYENSGKEKIELKFVYHEKGKNDPIEIDVSMKLKMD